MVDANMIEMSTPATAAAGRAAGGGRETIRYAVVPCSLDRVLVAASDRGICAIAFGDDPDTLVADLRKRFPKARLDGGDAAFRVLVKEIVNHVEAPRQALEVPLDVRGTAFQEQVWRALREIPVGATATYAEIAARIGRPTAARAVAQACAANPVAVVVPCHRVIGSGGALSGYRGGVHRKRALLAREGVEIEGTEPPARQRRAPRAD